MARTVLITGFEPFGGESENPSWEAVRQLEGETIDGYRLAPRRMPCVFGEAIARLEEEIAALSPSVVICVGQAGGRAEISLERIAINLQDARIPDNAGAQPLDREVIEGGPAAYFSGLPVKAILRDLLAAGVPAAISHTAGTFVCNHIFYGACHAARRLGRRIGHMDEAGAPSLSVAVIVEALRIAVASTLRNEVDAALIGGAVS